MNHENANSGLKCSLNLINGHFCTFFCLHFEFFPSSMKRASATDQVPKAISCSFFSSSVTFAHNYQSLVLSVGPVSLSC